jgi:glucose-6-phosphate-specific signal transduction histidine kinase
VPVALALAFLVSRMPRSLIGAYCVLGALSLLYLALVHLPARASGRSLRYFPKEFVVALLFAAASALPAWDEARRRAMGMPRHHPLLLLCPLFAALCWLNCVAIEGWEQHSGGRRIRLLALLTIAAACFSLSQLMSHPARWLAVAVTLSGALFLVLDRSRLTAAARRIAADLALLTPLLLPIAARLTR